MSQSEKAALYKELKDAGVQFSKHYREYSTSELSLAVNQLRAARPAPEPQPEQPAFDPSATAAAYAAMTAPPEPQPEQASLEQPDLLAHRPVNAEPPAPVRHADPSEMAGARQNTKALDEPIRVDPDTGYIWYQEEVLKPAFPKPRGRRVLTYTETGTQTQQIKSGEYTESFEIAGNQPGRPAQAKITLPSYQVGIYKDPRFPFKIHVYNERRGFDFAEVQQFYGGSELVPPSVKRIYVENVLCYDIRTVIRAIQDEDRHNQLTGRYNQA